MNGSDTGVDNVGSAASVVEYDLASQSLRCAGLPEGAEISVVNFGGVQVNKAIAVGGEATVALVAQPQGSYLAIIKSAGTVRTHKFLKW